MVIGRLKGAKGYKIKEIAQKLLIVIIVEFEKCSLFPYDAIVLPILTYSLTFETAINFF